ncbi:carbohydrate sulfotransferase 12-like isoform X2 [Micropterus salmoides]|uniref:carbohydrate sulfotransferase 12-like isoform X2 n=1 Tax=Micropterus salmoides TaxID=27706 RepID=UPI0018EAA997|nr:carbohydrate sulfotransferase 12-like isoform X2 [Micropterus salmoides]
MGIWRGLRVAFVLGSLFMILLIILYWDDVGGFTFYPLHNPKHEALHSESYRQATTGPSHSASTSRSETSSSFVVPTTSSRTTMHPEETGGAAEEHTEDEGKNKQEQRKEKPKQNEETERSHTDVDFSEQEARKKRLLDMCSGKDGVEFTGRTRPFEQIPNRELDHLIVDDTHQIIYCYVPKVACTNWKRVMVVLSQSLISPSSGKPYTDPEAVPPDLVHNSSLHLTFAKPNEDFYRQFGSVMVRRYGNVSGSLPETAAEAYAAGIKPTFQQFITYLLDPETERENIFNEHWRQVYRLCHPCQVKYDFIGKLETLETDAEDLLKLMEVDHLLRFPSGARNRTAASWERDWFTQIPISMRRELYKLYEPDFKLFGYPKPDSVLHQ